MNYWRLGSNGDVGNWTNNGSGVLTATGWSKLNEQRTGGKLNTLLTAHPTGCQCRFDDKATSKGRKEERIEEEGSNLSDFFYFLFGYN